jgi:anti-sigma regulatory factor (Ser/Thr protein kinase)
MTSHSSQRAGCNDIADAQSRGAERVTSNRHAWREIALPDGLEAPRVARRWLLDGLAAVPTDVVETATLLVSELVTNAVVHGRPRVTAKMRQVDDTLDVVVTDSGETMPIAPDDKPPDPHRPGDRGLFIVARLASEWGIRPLAPGPGKAVWFRLRP